MTNSANKKMRIATVVVVLLILVGGVTAWYNLYHEVAQPSWITSDPRNAYLYGSAGAERDAGIPYWIWLVLPRLFPEYLHYPGGYAALGMSWEESREMPVGFSKKIVGYVRVAANCAVCHATSYRTGPDETSTVVPALPGRTTDIKPLLYFFKQAASDPRFNAGELLAEVDRWTKLSLLDQLLYRFVLIPQARKAMIEQNSVMLDAALQRHSQNPYAPFDDSGMKTFEGWVNGAKAPPYPLPVDETRVAAGKPLFAQHCGSCHSLDGKRQVVPIGEIGTDRALLDHWTSDSHSANAGLNRDQAEMVKGNGYMAAPLNGVWLRGPYLHNASVPTVRDLLQPPALRSQKFYRGNDLVDSANVGFVSTEAEEKGRRQFAPVDTSRPGMGNAGHLYGVTLSSSDKDALLEFLKLYNLQLRFSGRFCAGRASNTDTTGPPAPGCAAVSRPNLREIGNSR